MNRIPKFSEAFAIAIHAAAELAANANHRAQWRTLADNYHMSRHHLAKVMGRLVQAGLVRSERGPDGGYQLARPPGTISLLDVFEAVEGPMNTSGCLFDRPVCNGHCCLFGDVLANAASQIRSYMAETTLAQAAACLAGTPPPTPAPPYEQAERYGAEQPSQARTSS